MKKLLVTAALPYSNGRLHVGHIAGAYITADIYVRYQRMLGRDVRFICGSDDHGVAIMLSAEKEGKSPAEVAKYYNERQAEDFKGLNISFDVYGATSDSKYHRRTSQDLFLRLYEKGYFEKKESSQFYDEQKEMFLPDRFVKGKCKYCGAEEQNGDQCEECGKVLDVETLLNAKSVFSGKPATVKKTTHWFLDLSRFEDDVASWLEASTLREQTRKYVRGLLSAGLVKRSMTRDIDWGVPVPIEDPDAKGKVLYVWFDAPIGYISNTLELCERLDGDSEKYTDWWKSEDTEIFHFIGEDNTIFHCVIWIAMLKAEETYQLPKGVIVNQFLNIKFPDKEEEKMSKSRGTAIWIGEYLEKGGNADTLRYYLTAIAPEKARTVYKPDDLVQRNNTDLANVLGNLVNRIVSFTRKYCGPNIPTYLEDKVEEVDRDFQKAMQEAFTSASQSLDEFAFKQALDTLMDFARTCNKYVDDKAPWKTRKEDMEATALTLNFALRAIYFLGVTLIPFIPETGEKILKILSIDKEGISWNDALEAMEAGHALNEPEILFSKMEMEEWV